MRTRDPRGNKTTRSGGGDTEETSTAAGEIETRFIGAQGNRSIEFYLQNGQRIIADAGAMAYMDGAIKMETKMGGLGKALGRVFSGEDLFLNHFTGTAAADGQARQTVAFSVPYPGDIDALTLRNGEAWKLSRGAFLVSTPNVDVSGKLNIRGIIPFGSEEGLVLTKVTATSDNAKVWIASYGHITRHEIGASESLLVDNENFLACPVDSSYELSKVGGIKSLIFGGEGLAMRFRGPCTVYTQSKGMRSLANALLPYLPPPSGGGGFDIDLAGGGRANRNRMGSPGRKKSKPSKKKRSRRRYAPRSARTPQHGGGRA